MIIRRPLPEGLKRKLSSSYLAMGYLNRFWPLQFLVRAVVSPITRIVFRRSPLSLIRLPKKKKTRPPVQRLREVSHEWRQNLIIVVADTVAQVTFAFEALRW